MSGRPPRSAPVTGFHVTENALREEAPLNPVTALAEVRGVMVTGAAAS